MGALGATLSFRFRAGINISIGGRKNGDGLKQSS